MRVYNTSSDQITDFLSAAVLIGHISSRVTVEDATLSKEVRSHIIEIPERRLLITVEAVGNPHWLTQFLRSCRSLLRLEKNWDSYGAVELDPRALRAAYRFLNSAMSATTPSPAYVPTSTGGVQLEWHEKGIDIEIAFEAEKKSEIYIEDHNTNELIEDTIEDYRYDVVRRFIGRLG